MNMLVARAQLNVVEEMLAEFANPPQTTQLLALVQAQHVAIVTLLRAVGHVLEKVDADTPARKAWLLSAWKTWKTEPIFANFIELNRNQLLKEFRGGLGLKNPALTHTGVVANPDAPRDASLVVDFSPNNVRTEDGRFALPLFRDAVAFWDRPLREAEQAFKGLT